MPTLGSMQPSWSHPPVVSAMRGMSPSDCFFGRRVSSGSVSAVSAHSFTSGIATWRRHLPIWMTSGMSLPIGTFCSVNFPVASVSAVTTGAPVTAAALVARGALRERVGHGVRHVDDRVVERQAFRSARYTVPVTVVSPPPAHTFCLHCRPTHAVPASPPLPNPEPVSSPKPESSPFGSSMMDWRGVPPQAAAAVPMMQPSAARAPRACVVLIR